MHVYAALFAHTKHHSHNIVCATTGSACVDGGTETAAGGGGKEGSTGVHTGDAARFGGVSGNSS